jgi:hypothetical protein
VEIAGKGVGQKKRFRLSENVHRIHMVRRNCRRLAGLVTLVESMMRAVDRMQFHGNVFIKESMLDARSQDDE